MLSPAEKSLKDPPKNVKEAIDWLALVGEYGKNGLGGQSWNGTGKPEKLETALTKLPGFDETAYYNRRFRSDSLSYYIYRYAQALNSGFLGYNDQNSEKPSGESYTSAYSGVGWIDDEASQYAKIFLFLACLVFYFITFVYWMCKGNGRWERKTLSDSGPFREFLTAMGFPSNPPNREKLCSQTKNLLTNMFNGFPELQAAYQDDSASSSYNDFLRNLERNGTQKETDIPLTTCKRISHAYLRSKQNGTEITNAIDKIKGELSSLSKSLTLYSTSSTDYFSNLKGHISSLLGKINTFDPNSVPSPVAPVAPLAGAVTTLTAAGGAGAAYGLNLFGIQGIVKALFGFK